MSAHKIANRQPSQSKLHIFIHFTIVIVEAIMSLLSATKQMHRKVIVEKRSNTDIMVFTDVNLSVVRKVKY